MTILQLRQGSFTTDNFAERQFSWNLFYTSFEIQWYRVGFFSADSCLLYESSVKQLFVHTWHGEGKERGESRQALQEGISRPDGKGFVRRGIFVTLSSGASPWQPTHVFVCLCFLLSTMCAAFYDTFCILLIYIYICSSCLYVCLLDLYIYISRTLSHLYDTHRFLHVSSVLAPQHVPTRPGTCGNLALPGGPPLNTTTLPVHSKGGCLTWLSARSDSVWWQSTPTLGVTSVDVVQKRGHTTYTPQYIHILGMDQFQNRSLTPGTSDYHTYTHTQRTLQV